MNFSSRRVGRTVHIVQPYLPRYRVPFFEGLRRELAMDNIEVRVIAGRPGADQGLRGDAASASWSELAPSLTAKVAGRRVDVASSIRTWSKGDGVIVPLMGSSVDALLASVLPLRLRVGVWGHVAPFTSPGNMADLAVERWQMRRADRVFAYTPAGARYAVANGVSADKVTTVMNSLDTKSLEDDLRAERSARALSTFARRRYGSNGYFLYLGGLDSSKRIEFLAESLDHLWSKSPSTHIVVAGEGTDSWRLDPARGRDQVTMVGRVEGREKASLLLDAKGLINPGRVGLIAVDALVAGAAVLTTEWAYHAPEVEYLTRGESVFYSADRPTDYTALIMEVDVSKDRDVSTTWQYPTLDDMTANFAEGVRLMMRDR